MTKVARCGAPPAVPMAAGHTTAGGLLSAAILASAMAITPVAATAQIPPRLPAGVETTASADLLRAIDLYTGVAGRVDDDEARLLLEGAAADGGDVLAGMWIARVHSRGRMTFPRDEARARALGAELLPAIRDLAAAGDVEAAFLMGTAYDAVSYTHLTLPTKRIV